MTRITQLKIKKIIELKKKRVKSFKAITRIIKLETPNLEKSRSPTLKKNIK